MIFKIKKIHIEKNIRNVTYKSSEKIIAYNNIDNNYYQIGRNIICSGNGNILISTINNYTDLKTFITSSISFNKTDLLGGRFVSSP